MMADLHELFACERSELILYWRRAFGNSPPKHSSTAFLRKVLAHELQCKAHGDVPKRVTCGREASAVSLYDLCFLAGETWQEQVERVFD